MISRQLEDVIKEAYDFIRFEGVRFVPVILEEEGGHESPDILVVHLLLWPEGEYNIRC